MNDQNDSRGESLKTVLDEIKELREKDRAIVEERHQIDERRYENERRINALVAKGLLDSGLLRQIAWEPDEGDSVCRFSATGVEQKIERAIHEYWVCDYHDSIKLTPHVTLYVDDGRYTLEFFDEAAGYAFIEEHQISVDLTNIVRRRHELAEKAAALDETLDRLRGGLGQNRLTVENHTAAFPNQKTIDFYINDERRSRSVLHHYADEPPLERIIRRAEEEGWNQERTATAIAVILTFMHQLQEKKTRTILELLDAVGTQEMRERLRKNNLLPTMPARGPIENLVKSASSEKQENP